nr:helix-turn-helix transcriptional regulator [Staphylococcus aureus]
MVSYIFLLCNRTELKVSRQTINAIENNKYDPTLTLAFKLARLFDTTVDELFS